ncbi:hypothetical protein [Nitrobacter sp.]|uniref:hypothetical protein n=1 Tax=Nitrobacter sp. TaxID=29420 RepID=UPI00399D785B
MSILRSKSLLFAAALASGALALASAGHARGGPGGLGPVHGPGSSHNPVSAPTVRDHRGPQHRPNPRAYYCRRHWSAPGCNVHDHRTPPPIPCYGNLC